MTLRKPILQRGRKKVGRVAVTLPVIAGIHASWGFGALFVVMAIAASGIFMAVLTPPRAGAIIGGQLSLT